MKIRVANLLLLFHESGIFFFQLSKFKFQLICISLLELFKVLKKQKEPKKNPFFIYSIDQH